MPFPDQGQAEPDMLDPRCNRTPLTAADGAADPRRTHARGAAPPGGHAAAGPQRTHAGAGPRAGHGAADSGHGASDPAGTAEDGRDLDLGRIRAVVDAVPEAVLVAEPDGELRFTNRAADRLFADQPVVDRDDLLSRFEPVGVDRPEALPAVDRAEARDEAVIVRQRSRPTRWFALRTVPLESPDEEPVPTMAARSDAPTGDAPGSDRPAAPDATVAFVLRDVTDSRDLRPIREAFVGLVSHELRTPITTIYAGSSVLAREPSLSPPATRTLARDVSSEAARLYDLVEDLLVLARIERGVLDPLDEPVLVERVVDSTIRVALDRHGDAAIRLLPSAGTVAARGDATYIDQAARNIVLAALRRPGQAAEPDLEIEVRSNDAAATVDVVVRDRGPAVSDAELMHVFDLPDATAGPHQSIGGLGLFVARQIVESMGGRTWAANRPDGGLELGFGLRIDPAA
jgi:signal transduction histidine kinase